MITQIKGRLLEKTPTYLVIDCNGIGYEVNISLNTFSSLSSEENIQLFTHLQIRRMHIFYMDFLQLLKGQFLGYLLVFLGSELVLQERCSHR